MTTASVRPPPRTRHPHPHRSKQTPFILTEQYTGYPVILTTWHLIFATFMTQILARTTTLLDARKTVKMTGRIYLRAILPIGLFFSLSLICGNLTYLYLSVAFIQMLKVSPHLPPLFRCAGFKVGVVGYDTSCSLASWLGNGCFNAKFQGPL